MEGDPRVAAYREQLERLTTVLDREREAFNGSQFTDLARVFTLLARIELLGSKLHKQLVVWHSIFPKRPALTETDSFWADLKELREVKAELENALGILRAYEKAHPSLHSQLERSTGEVVDIERYFSSYLDRVNRG